MKLIALLLLVPSLSCAAPFLLQTEKMPPGESQPDAFYALVNGARLECETLRVASTDTVQMRCDIESLPAGTYQIVVYAVKTSNSLETASAPRTLTVSKKYGARTYLGQRLLNTAYVLTP